MSVTATKKFTLADALNAAEPNEIADALRKTKLGRMLAPVKITLTGITAIAALDVTAFKKGDATLAINAGLADLADKEALPPILAVRTCRVTTSGTANSVGTYAIGDAGSTAVSPTAGANVGLALLSDNGKSITFPTTITGVVLEYIPRMASDPDAAFAPVP